MKRHLATLVNARSLRSKPLSATPTSHGLLSASHRSGVPAANLTVGRGRLLRFCGPSIIASPVAHFTPWFYQCCLGGHRAENHKPNVAPLQVCGAQVQKALIHLRNQSRGRRLCCTPTSHRLASCVLCFWVIREPPALLFSTCAGRTDQLFSQLRLACSALL